MVKSKNDNQPICKVTLFGTKRWLLNGKLHRENGPAIEYADGSKVWFFHNKLHRLDGPAVEHPNGRRWWWYHGELINSSSQEEFDRLIKLKVLW